MHSEKSRLRKWIRPQLAALSSVWREEASRALVHRISQLELWRNASVVGLFAGRNDEMDTTLFWETGKSFVYPKITGSELRFLTVNSHLSLEKGTWNVHEPTGNEVAEPDLVLVPGLAFDAQGGRLGRGKGYYDRWLAAHPKVATLGVGFDFQLVEKIPLEPHDRMMDAVATERRFFQS